MCKIQADTQAVGMITPNVVRVTDTFSVECFAFERNLVYRDRIPPHLRAATHDHNAIRSLTGYPLPLLRLTGELYYQ